MSTSPTDPLTGMSMEEKKILLRRLLTKTTDPGSQPFALSRGQQALWFLQHLIPDNFAYNIPISLHFAPPLDLAAFKIALEAVVARHPALRTTCRESAGKPRQQVSIAAPFQLDQRIAPESEAQLKQQVISEYQRPFDLDGPLFRVTIWRGTTSDVVLFTIHHLMFDGRSGAILLDDLTSLYRAGLDGGAAQLAPLAATYRDFVGAQEKLLESADGARMWNYWAGELSGELEDLTLPRNPTRSNSLTLRGESIPFALSSGRTERLNALAQANRTTAYSVIFTAAQIVLYNFTGQTNLVIGTPFAGRTRLEWADVIGYFVNTLPIRVPFDPDSTISAQLRAVHDHLSHALDYQDFPFPAMVERLKVARDSSRSPVFQVIVNVTQLTSRARGTPESHTENGLGWQFGNSRARPFDIPQLEGQVDLSVEMFETTAGLLGSWRYGAQSMDRPTAERLLNQFRTVLDLAIENPAAAIRELLVRLSSPAGQAEGDDKREEMKF